MPKSSSGVKGAAGASAGTLAIGAVSAGGLSDDAGGVALVVSAGGEGMTVSGVSESVAG